MGVGVAVGCGATAAVGFGGLRGFCSPLRHGVGIAAVVVGAAAGVGEGCGAARFGIQQK